MLETWYHIQLQYECELQFLWIEQRLWHQPRNIINYYSTPNPSAINQPNITTNMAKSRMTKSAIRVKYQTRMFFTRDLNSVAPMHVWHGTHLLVCIHRICKQTEHPCPAISFPLADYVQGLYLFFPPPQLQWYISNMKGRHKIQWHFIWTSQWKIKVHELCHEICKFSLFINLLQFIFPSLVPEIMDYVDTLVTASHTRYVVCMHYG